MGEFELIERYFTWARLPASAASDFGPATSVELGIGDDCALLAPDGRAEIAVSTDLLIAGRHFFEDVDPEALGHKSLAVNLSDLAAMGARPRAFTLGLALPKVDVFWLEGFSRGLARIARDHGCDLIGGDTTRGPLAIAITIFGDVPRGAAIRRSGAAPGDDVWVSGTLGAPALAVRILQGALADPDEQLTQARVVLERPIPRVALGLSLRGTASAMIDLSDGLLGDLGHVLKQSGVGAKINVDALPGSPLLKRAAPGVWLSCVLTGGDDYELCFTAPASKRSDVQQQGERTGTSLTRVGEIVAGHAMSFHDGQGHAYVFPEGLVLTGYDHFG